MRTISSIRIAPRHVIAAALSVRPRQVFLVLAGALLLAGCGLGQAAATSTAPTFPVPTLAPPTPTPTLFVPTPAGPSPQDILNDFCGALRDSDFNKAYSYFSDHYKAKVTDPSQIPGIFGVIGTANDCQEFGNGGFLTINGNRATDQVTFTVTPNPINGFQFPPHDYSATVSFVQTGSTWQIDSIV